MNILIYGPMASGKTLLANALKYYYESHKQKVGIISDGNNYTSSVSEGERLRELGERKLYLTKNSKLRHSIVTTQAYPDQIYGFYDNYDYHINIGRI